MQKTKRGIELIDDYSLHNQIEIVVDAELLVTLNKKFLHTSFEITELNRQVISYIKQVLQDINSVIIATVSNHKKYQEIISEHLMLQIECTNMFTENNYKKWLEINEPSTHLSIQERRYYCKTSFMVNQYTIKQLFGDPYGY